MTDTALKGGPGSGNFNHAGRPGLVGGSAPRGASKPAGVPAVPHGDQFLPGDVDRPTWDDRLAQLDKHERDPRAEALLTQGLADLYRETGLPELADMGWSGATEEMRQIVKAQITDRLAQATAIDETDVRRFINQWAISSNDHDMGSLALQQDAADFFGVPLSEWQQGRIDEIKKAYGRYQPYHPSDEDVNIVFDRLLPADQQKVLLWRMYDDTQRALVKAGYNRETGVVRLYRGVRYDDYRPEAQLTEGDRADYRGSTLESWSVDWGTALGFAHPDPQKYVVGLVLAMDVPVRNIISTARTGFGCLAEGEFVILGSVPGSRVRVHDRPPW